MTNYTYRAEWSPDDDGYIGSCLEFPGRYFRAQTAHEAVTGVQDVIHEALTELAQYQCPAPQSLTDRRHSGRFLVRTSAALHSRLMVEAAEQGVSLNQWVVHKLSDRPIRNPLDDF